MGCRGRARLPRERVALREGGGGGWGGRGRGRQLGANEDRAGRASPAECATGTHAAGAAGRVAGAAGRVRPLAGWRFIHAPLVARQGHKGTPPQLPRDPTYLARIGGGRPAAGGGAGGQGGRGEDASAAVGGGGPAAPCPSQRYRDNPFGTASYNALPHCKKKTKKRQRSKPCVLPYIPLHERGGPQVAPFASSAWTPRSPVTPPRGRASYGISRIQNLAVFTRGGAARVASSACLCPAHQRWGVWRHSPLAGQYVDSGDASVLRASDARPFVARAGSAPPLPPTLLLNGSGQFGQRGSRKKSHLTADDWDSGRFSKRLRAGRGAHGAPPPFLLLLYVLYFDGNREAAWSAVGPQGGRPPRAGARRAEGPPPRGSGRGGVAGRATTAQTR